MRPSPKIGIFAGFSSSVFSKLLESLSVVGRSRVSIMADLSIVVGLEKSPLGGVDVEFKSHPFGLDISFGITVAGTGASFTKAKLLLTSFRPTVRPAVAPDAMAFASFKTAISSWSVTEYLPLICGVIVPLVSVDAADGEDPVSEPTSEDETRFSS